MPVVVPSAPTSTTSAISPYATTYATTTPYITLAEFLASPTALEVTDLIPGADQAAQNRAMTDSIARASSWVDTICKQVLAATIDVERGRYRINRWGYVRIPLNYKPILEIVGVNVGTKPSNLTALTDFSDVVARKNSVEIQVWPFTSYPAYGTGCGWGIGSEVLVDTTYVNGWVNTLTSGATIGGATIVPVTLGLAIYPGTQLTIFDGEFSEVTTVASTYVHGATSLPLTAPLTFAHAKGVSVSNLPADVKQACVLLTCVLIQTRGSDAIVLDSLDTPQRVSTAYGASGNSVSIATDLLIDVTRRV